ncbi:MAG: gliding motility-associated C-terminal domain-containing protein [Saprospiraceae bacterium]|nr:gliding motility-associated C-terminal domain-containing protein [Saprospiraceae bacterium]
MINVPAGGNCCCGQFTELFNPNLDFEEPPAPAPGNLILYSAGEFFGGWTCTRATIDHKDAFFGNLNLGNPNGRSNFIDLHGSPGFGAIEYNLTGLTPGNLYRIEFWTAQNGSGYTSTGTLKIAGGAWLNVNWTVSVDGSVFWFKVSHEFMAMASTARMEFSSVGGSEWGGTLLDDIHIFECPGDQEAPVVFNPPEDLEVECDKNIPKVPVLNVNDNCDLNPDFTFKETVELIDPCTKIITRSWDIKDDCGNVTPIQQKITVADKTPPEIKKSPVDALTHCSGDFQKIFTDWIKNNGGASAVDECGKVNWRSNYDHIPQKSCDTILVEFIAQDHCGLETSVYANFMVLDTAAPKLNKSVENKNIICNPFWRDSLRTWLFYHAFAEAKDDCDTVFWSHNFKGDTSTSPLNVTFYFKDRCGNVDSTTSQFIHRDGSDTTIVNITSCSIQQNTSDTLKYQGAGCDSIVILNTIQVFSDTILLQMNTCDPNQKMQDSLFLKNASGCDSVVITSYTLHPVNVHYIRDSSCAYTAAYKDTLHVAGQFCDSLIVTEYIPLRKDSTFLMSSSCDSTQTGIFTMALKNQLGCDSIVVSQVNFASRSITHLQSFECGLAMSYADTIIILNTSCDSLVVTEHIPLRVDSLFLDSRSCDSTKVGSFMNRFTNLQGCDSIVFQTVILDPSYHGLVFKSSCNASDTGVIKNYYKNQYGCDSIIEVRTTLLRSDSLFVQKFSCDLSQVGTSSQFLKNQYGCDSIVTTKTDFVKPDTSYQQKHTCRLNQARIDTLIIQGVLCDSVLIIETKFVASDTSYLQAKTCFSWKSGLDSTLLINQNGCDSLIYIQTSYEPLRLQITIDSISCFNAADGKLHIKNSGDFGKNFNVILNSSNLGFLTTINPLSSGNYQLFVQDSAGCVTDTLQFSLMNPELLTTDLGADLLVAANENIQLKLNYNRKPQIIQWFPPGLTNCTNCDQINFTTDKDLWVYALSLDERFCPSQDSVFIRVRKQSHVYAPNVFSPNGDNINDYFYLMGSENVVIESFQIFNRWGELLFNNETSIINQPDSGWDGSFKGSKMNPGVFIYYARVRHPNEQVQDFSGDFNLIR